MGDDFKIKNEASPVWLDVAEKELGIKEIKGINHEERIVEYHRTTSLNANDDETPWCSSFVNWCVEKSGLRGTKKAWARSWNFWGVKLKVPAYGCIVVMSRGSNPAHGHVGFFVGWDGRKKIKVLGGNQGDSVSIVSFPTTRVVSYRWP